MYTKNKLRYILLISIFCISCSAAIKKLLVDLTWSVAKDTITQLLPFKHTANLFVDLITKEIGMNHSLSTKTLQYKRKRKKRKQKVIKIGMIDFLPATQNQKPTGVSTQFLSQYISKKLNHKNVEISTISPRLFTNKKGKSLIRVKPTGETVLRGKLKRFRQYDYLMTGVVHVLSDKMLMNIRLLNPRKKDKMIDLKLAAQKDENTLALLGENKILSKPHGNFLYCKEDHRKSLHSKIMNAKRSKCRFEANDQGQLCFTCQAANPSKWKSKDRTKLWRSIRQTGSQFCMNIQSHKTKQSYRSSLLGINQKSIKLSKQFSQLKAGDRYQIKGREDEEYEVLLSLKDFYHTGTKIPRRVAVFLSIDGVNSLGQKLDIPSEGRRWLVNSGKTTHITGWQLNNSKAKRFKFVDHKSSVAVRLGKEDNIGQITAVVYAEKDQGCPHPNFCRPVPRQCAKLLRSFPKKSDSSKSVYSKRYRTGGTSQGMGGRGIGRSGFGSVKSKRSYSESRRESKKGVRLGTGEGKEVQHHIRSVKLELEPSPMVVMNLHYE